MRYLVGSIRGLETSLAAYRISPALFFAAHGVNSINSSVLRERSGKILLLKSLRVLIDLR